jgi:hypothetical protein
MVQGDQAAPAREPALIASTGPAPRSGDRWCDLPGARERPLLVKGGWLLSCGTAFRCHVRCLAPTPLIDVRAFSTVFHGGARATLSCRVGGGGLQLCGRGRCFGGDGARVLRRRPVGSAGTTTAGEGGRTVAGRQSTGPADDTDAGEPHRLRATTTARSRAPRHCPAKVFCQDFETIPTHSSGARLSRRRRAFVLADGIGASGSHSMVSYEPTRGRGLDGIRSAPRRVRRAPMPPGLVPGRVAAEDGASWPTSARATSPVRCRSRARWSGGGGPPALGRYRRDHGSDARDLRERHDVELRRRASLDSQLDGG